MKVHPLVLGGRILGALALGVPSIPASFVLATVGGGWAETYLGEWAVLFGIAGTMVGVWAAGVLLGAVAGQLIATALLAILRRLGLRTG